MARGKQCLLYLFVLKRLRTGVPDTWYQGGLVPTRHLLVEKGEGGEAPGRGAAGRRGEGTSGWEMRRGGTIYNSVKTSTSVFFFLFLAKMHALDSTATTGYHPEPSPHQDFTLGPTWWSRGLHSVTFTNQHYELCT